MASSAFRVRGLKELEQALKALDDGVKKRVLRKTLRTTLEPIADAVEARTRRAPSPTHPEIGHAADNVLTKTRITADGTATGKVGYDKRAYWVRFVEFGTVYIQAFPAIRPAWEENKGQALRTVQSTLGSGIQDEARKASRKSLKK